MRSILLLFLCSVLLAQDGITTGEISCGRDDHKKPKEHRCQCLKARLEAVKQAREKCLLIEDKEKRFACYRETPECHDVEVVERENNPKNMPIQCKRYCSVAKCTCCVS